MGVPQGSSIAALDRGEFEEDLRNRAGAGILETGVDVEAGSDRETGEVDLGLGPGRRFDPRRHPTRLRELGAGRHPKIDDHVFGILGRQEDEGHATTRVHAEGDREQGKRDGSRYHLLVCNRAQALLALGLRPMRAVDE